MEPQKVLDRVLAGTGSANAVKRKLLADIERGYASNSTAVASTDYFEFSIGSRHTASGKDLYLRCQNGGITEVGKPDNLKMDQLNDFILETRRAKSGEVKESFFFRVESF